MSQNPSFSVLLFAGACCTEGWRAHRLVWHACVRRGGVWCVYRHCLAERDGAVGVGTAVTSPAWVWYWGQLSTAMASPVWMWYWAQLSTATASPVWVRVCVHRA